MTTLVVEDESICRHLLMEVVSGCGVTRCANSKKPSSKKNITPWRANCFLLATETQTGARHNRENAINFVVQDKNLTSNTEHQMEQKQTKTVFTVVWQ